MSKIDYYHIKVSEKTENELKGFKWLYVVANIPVKSTKKFERRIKSTKSTFLGWADRYPETKSTVIIAYELLPSSSSDELFDYKQAFTMHQSIGAQGDDRKLATRVSSYADFIDLSEIQWISRKAWFSICLSETEIESPLSDDKNMADFSQTLNDLLDRGKAIAVRWDHNAWERCAKMQSYDYGTRYGRLPFTHKEAFYVSDRSFPQTTETPYYWSHIGDARVQDLANFVARLHVSPVESTRLHWATKSLSDLESTDAQRIVAGLGWVESVFNSQKGSSPNQFTPRFWNATFKSIAACLDSGNVDVSHKKKATGLVVSQGFLSWLQGFKQRHFAERRDLKRLKQSLGKVWGYSVKEWQSLALNESTIRSIVRQLDVFEIHDYDQELIRLIPATTKEKTPLNSSKDYRKILQHIRSNQIPALKKRLQSILENLGKEVPPPLEFTVYQRIERILRKNFGDTTAQTVFYQGMAAHMKQSADTKNFAAVTQAARYLTQRSLPEAHVDTVMQSLLEAFETFLNSLKEAKTATNKQARISNLTNLLRTIGNLIAEHESRYRDKLSTETFQVLQAYSPIELIQQLQKSGNEAYAEEPDYISFIGLGGIELCKATIARLYAIIDPAGRNSPAIKNASVIDQLKAITSHLPPFDELKRYTYAPVISFGSSSRGLESRETSHSYRAVRILGGLHFLGIHENYSDLMTPDAKKTLMAILRFLSQRNPGPLIGGLAFRTYAQAFSVLLIPRAKKTPYWKELTAEEQDKADGWLKSCHDHLHEAISQGAPYVYKNSKGHGGYLSHELGVATTALITSKANPKTIERAIRLLERSFDSSRPLGVRYTTTSTGYYSEKGSVARAVTVHLARWLNAPKSDDTKSHLVKAMKQFTTMLPYLELVTQGQTAPHTAHDGISNYYYYSTIPFAATAAWLLSQKDSSHKWMLSALNGSLTRMLDPTYVKDGTGLPFVEEGHKTHVKVYTNIMASLTLQALEGNMLLGPESA